MLAAVYYKQQQLVKRCILSSNNGYSKAAALAKQELLLPAGSSLPLHRCRCSKVAAAAQPNQCPGFGNSKSTLASTNHHPAFKNSNPHQPISEEKPPNRRYHRPINAKPSKIQIRISQSAKRNPQTDQSPSEIQIRISQSAKRNPQTDASTDQSTPSLPKFKFGSTNQRRETPKSTLSSTNHHTTFKNSNPHQPISEEKPPKSTPASANQHPAFKNSNPHQPISEEKPPNRRYHRPINAKPSEIQIRISQSAKRNPQTDATTDQSTPTKRNPKINTIIHQSSHSFQKFKFGSTNQRRETPKPTNRLPKFKFTSANQRRETPKPTTAPTNQRQAFRNSNSAQPISEEKPPNRRHHRPINAKPSKIQIRISQSAKRNPQTDATTNQSTSSLQKFKSSINANQRKTETRTNATTNCLTKPSKIQIRTSQSAKRNPQTDASTDQSTPRLPKFKSAPANQRRETPKPTPAPPNQRQANHHSPNG
ncbi:nucleolar protein dao-5-like [Penaeus vannamei]|uniref:nucleolar protein dao-5-like n=1 Tax=Penaeus vannamei TaxID=6689 RepID=UPI00387F8FE0